MTTSNFYATNLGSNHSEPLLKGISKPGTLSAMQKVTDLEAWGQQTTDLK